MTTSALAPDNRLSFSPAQHGVTPALLLVLALLSALAPFATDLYLPAFPDMMQGLAVSATQVQLSLTAFLVGVAAGQLVFGPLSDRFGRVAPLVWGAAICVGASAVAALAPTIGVLIAARFVQGLAGAAGMVIGRAIVADRASGKDAARAFSLMMMVGGVAPVIAPLLGSMLNGLIGWRGLLWVVCALASAMLLSVLAIVRESHPAQRRAEARAVAAVQGSGLRDLRGRVYLAYALAFGLSFAVLMAYISASPFVYQNMIGMSPVQYGMAFGVNAAGITAMGAVSARLVHRWGPRRLLGAGQALLLASTIVLGLLVAGDAPVAWLPIAIFAAVSSLGMTMGNGTALALAAVPRAAGSASAVLGAVQFGLAALVSPLVSLGGTETAVPLAIVMLVCAGLSVMAFRIAGPVS
jgi:DHA1 family bicyclomycin/chloramphenicol resistance-like MFS transporter